MSKISGKKPFFCEQGPSSSQTSNQKPSENIPLVITLVFLYIMISIFFIPVSSIASGSEVSEGFKNIKSGQGWDTPAGGIPERALSISDLLIVKKAAEAGDPESQLLIGTAYFEGVGVLKDSKFAMEMWRRAAEANHPIAPVAQYNLGTAYHTNKEFSESLKWTTKSAEAGFVHAQYNLGEMYNFADGVPQNFEKAFKWYYQAALGGLAESQFEVGLFYFRGKGTQKNGNLALQWFRRAAAQGHKPSMELLAQNQAKLSYPPKRHRQWSLE